MTGDGLESHLKKQWDFGEAIDKQDKAIAALEHFTGQLMAQNHFDAEGIDGKRRELLQRLTFSYVGYFSVLR